MPYWWWLSPVPNHINFTQFKYCQIFLEAIYNLHWHSTIFNMNVELRILSIDSTSTDQQLMTCTPKPSSSKTRSWKWISWTRVAMMRWGSWLYNIYRYSANILNPMWYSSKKVATKEYRHFKKRYFGFPLVKRIFNCCYNNRSCISW